MYFLSPQKAESKSVRGRLSNIYTPEASSSREREIEFDAGPPDPRTNCGIPFGIRTGKEGEEKKKGPLGKTDSGAR